MIVYLDTSVVLRVLLQEPNPVRSWGRWERAYSSNLWSIEALRTVDRLRLAGHLIDREVATLVSTIRTIDETLTIRALDETIMTRASESFPTSVGTLDALHLSTALTIRQSATLDFFLTHDAQLATAAQSVGFEVAESEPRTS